MRPLSLAEQIASLSPKERAALRGEMQLVEAAASAGLSLDHSDMVRLGRQLKGVRDLMADGRWRTLAEVSDSLGIGFPEASVSARLRDIRKSGRTVERRRRGPGRGLWEYRYAVE